MAVLGGWDGGGIAVLGGWEGGWDGNIGRVGWGYWEGGILVLGGGILVLGGWDLSIGRVGS